MGLPSMFALLFLNIYYAKVNKLKQTIVNGIDMKEA